MNLRLLLLPAVLTGTLTALSAADAPKMKIPEQTLYCEKVQELPERNEHKYTATVGAYALIRIVPRVSGVLEKMHFKEGDFVKQGDLMYEIEDVTYKAEAEAAKYRLEQAEASLIYQKQQYDRQISLAEKDVIAVKTKEDAIRAYNYARAALAEAKAKLIVAEEDLSHTKIYAPVSGRVGKSAISSGNYITPASGTLITIVRIEPIYVTFSISERDLMKMFGSIENLKKYGQVRLELADGKEYPLTGTIKLTDNEVDSRTGTLKLWAVFENPDYTLNPGGLVNAVLSRETDRKIAAVPLSALLTDAKGNYVYVLGPEGIVQRRDIRIGKVSDNLLTVTEGLKPGEVVVVDGTHKTMPGGKVNPVFENAEK